MLWKEMTAFWIFFGGGLWPIVIISVVAIMGAFVTNLAKNKFAVPSNPIERDIYIQIKNNKRARKTTIRRYSEASAIIVFVVMCAITFLVCLYQMYID